MLNTLQEQTKFGFGEHDSSFSVGKQNIWHQSGTVLTDAPTIEEGIKAAGLDWTVELKDIQLQDGTPMPEWKSLVRTDINKPLQIFKASRYVPLQNIEAFKFFNRFIDNDLATLETAGSLYNGKKIYVLAKINSDYMDIDGKGDIVEKYILLSNSHDGTQSLYVGFCPIRVVCANTLTAAISNDASKLLRLRHTGNMVQCLSDIGEMMDVVNQGFMATEQMYKRLAQAPVNSKDLKKYVYAVFNHKQMEQILTDQVAIKSEDIEEFRKKLMEHVEEVFDMEYAHTAWTAYNAVNHYFNHEGKRTLDSRCNMLAFGTQDKIALHGAQLLAGIR